MWTVSTEGRLLFVVPTLCSYVPLSGLFYFHWGITLASVAQECRGVFSLQGGTLYKVLIQGSVHDTVSAQVQKYYTLLACEVKCSSIVVSLRDALNVHINMHTCDSIWHCS